jgi:hypothetical protein
LTKLNKKNIFTYDEQKKFIWGFGRL